MRRRGIPAVLRHRYGNATVVYMSAALENAGLAPSVLAGLYAGELSLCGVNATAASAAAAVVSRERRDREENTEGRGT